ncbi:hypothetical protein HNP24_001428 [Chryseobacterium sediminis]|uniref:Uncharacterized protein n=1 Tax=Chryseobacterium sediminis TaxID=1679494 RepID=A0ABR6PXR8_9FLAO|nr:hypothetical protein [Chryseobacterium sediminis]
MDPNYIKYDMTKFSDFTKQDEKLIVEVYEMISKFLGEI